MKKPSSIETNLVSLGVTLGSLLLVVLTLLFVVEQALGSKLQRFGSSTMPAQKSIADLRHSVSRLFERQAQLLSSQSQAELAPVRERAAIERGLGQARAQLDAVLPEIIGESDAAREGKRLAERTQAVLAGDAELLDSVTRRHATEAQFDTRTLAIKTALDKLIQDANAVAGVAHLEFVLELRRVAHGAPPEQVVRGDARVQQEAAGQVVAAVLRLGQLVGKIALARNSDELNSINANELAQNLARARQHLRELVSTLRPDDAKAERVRNMQVAFEALARQIAASDDPESLLALRRSTLTEAVRAAELRRTTLQGAEALSTELLAVEGIVARESAGATSSAQRTLWLARALSVLALLAAVAMGAKSAKRLRESVSGLRAQNHELETLCSDLKNLNEGLEGLVAERSAALVARERSMRLVLDSMNEGLISADLSGKVVGESSQAARSWFGEPAPEISLAAYLFPEDAATREDFALGYEQLAEDLLPFEATADVMPKGFARGERTYSLEYRQVCEEGRFLRVLVVVQDITEKVAAEAREREAREQHQVLAHLLRDKQGFRAFVRDAERLIGVLRAEPERDTALRALHTLKGNSGVIGMESIARRCHELENQLSDSEASIAAEAAKSLAELWRSRLERIEGNLSSEQCLELRETELSELTQGLSQRRDYEELLDLVESWKWTRTSTLLRRLASQAHRVGERLGKPLAVQVEHNNLRVMPGKLDDFWSSLVHVVRNAVDHGLEDPAGRRARGKPATGQLVLRTVQLPSGFAVELADDGGGVDFDALRAVARARGKTLTTQAELLSWVLEDGVSSRTTATEISGRGVGLSAVAAACRAGGGKLDIDSVTGRGTTFRFVFPNQAVQVRKAAGSGTFVSARPPRPSQAPKSAASS